MTRRPDAIEILVRNQTAVLVRHGMHPDVARREAEENVAVILEDLARIGLDDVYLSVALRRARVYRFRCQGLPEAVISVRLGISTRQVERDYTQELLRRRYVA